MRITDEPFINLYIGQNYADVVGLKTGKIRVRVPAPYLEDVDEIRRECFAFVASENRDEFALYRQDPKTRDRVRFRVTSFSSTDGNRIFVVRRPPNKVLTYDEMGFGDDAAAILLRPDLRGIVAFVGSMASGKTTAAAATVKARLERYGGMAIALEDPPETALDGEHGNGRCISVEVLKETGGYEGAVVKAMRSGADIIYLGEVRDEKSAIQVVQAGNNGQCIPTTLHGQTQEDGLKRLVSLAGGKEKDAAGMLSTGLAAIVHVELAERKINTQLGPRVIRYVKYRILEVAGHPDVQSVIRSGEFHHLKSKFEEQLAKRRVEK